MSSLLSESLRARTTLVETLVPFSEPAGSDIAKDLFSNRKTQN